MEQEQTLFIEILYYKPLVYYWANRKCLINSNYYTHPGDCMEEDKMQEKEKLETEDHMKKKHQKAWWFLF